MSVRRHAVSRHSPAPCSTPAGRSGIMLATAESCTGGMIAAALTDIAGSSDVVDRGFVTYSNEAKMEMLGVSRGDARCARRGVARDGAGDGGRRACAFARRHRAVGHRHCRAGRRLGRKSRSAWSGSDWPCRAASRSPSGRLFEDRGRAFIRREIGADGARDGARGAGRSGRPARRRSCRRAFRRRPRTCGRRGRTSSPSARRGCGS